MFKNILLTGEIQVGKSTIINKVIDKYFKNKVVSGFKTLAFYEDIKKEGYYIEDQLEKDNLVNEENIVGIVSEETNRCIGISKTFENKGVEILKRAMNTESDLILLDELGFFENNSENFKNMIMDIFETEIRVIGVLKKKDTEFLNSIKSRKDIKIIEVNIENREEIEEKIREYWKL